MALKAFLWKETDADGVATDDAELGALMCAQLYAIYVAANTKR